MSAVAIIPAKGRSTGVPGKNKRLLAGKPLVLWSIEAAKASSVSEIIVSTDDEEIARIARKASVSVLYRPPELAKDDTPTEAVISHVLMTLRVAADTTVLLQPTSPLRMPYYINNMIALLDVAPFDSVLSVTPDRHFYWMGKANRASPMNYVPRQRPMRQDIVPLFRENGSIYAFRTKGYLEAHCRLFGKVGLYSMDHPWAGIEIDTENDFQLMDAAMHLFLGAKVPA